MAHRAHRVDRRQGRFEFVENQSFENFYAHEYGAVLALARVLTGNRTQAEDVAHDAFAATLAAWDGLENPAGWIRTVLVNRARSGWRRHYAERRAHQLLAADIRVGRDLPAETEDFWQEVRRLPRRQAEAIALFYLEDRPVSDIAGILGCEESTVRVHLMRGRQRLASRLEVDYE